MGEAETVGARAHLIERRAEVCDGCSGCVRCCPTRAIRVVGGCSEVIEEKCVACGMCVGECGRGGHRVRDDSPEVVALLRSRRPVVVLLATEFVAALSPMTVVQIERALDTLGFCAVETTVLGEEMVAGAYEQLYSRDTSLLSIRSTCPVVTEFVRKFHPALVQALAPLVPPYIAQARLIKELYEGDVAVVYVSPCYARKDEARVPEFGGVVDVAIDFLELERLMAGRVAVPAQHHSPAAAVRRPGLLKEVSLTDGFPRQTVADRHMSESSVTTVRGLDDLERLLRAVEAGEAAPAIIDALNCEGCIDGPAVAPGLSLYAKRTIDSAARRNQGATRVSTRALLGVLPAINLLRSFTPAPVSVPRPSEQEIDQELARAGFTVDSAPDCGACGWPTCVGHATAVLQGDSTWDLCLPLQRSMLKEHALQLHASETLDPLTGIWNRRSYADRLALEMARHLRYGSELSIMLVDIDGLGALNDRYGEPAGDGVLVAVAARLAQQTRSTDLIARWIGDQFAVILPGIGKTAAFAVAEKLRESIGASPVSVDSDGYTQDIGVTASFGVAAAGKVGGEPADLLEAADAALRDAMASGGDQVRLAPG